MKNSVANAETVPNVFELSEEPDELLKYLKPRGLFLRDGDGRLYFWSRGDAELYPVRDTPGSAFYRYAADVVPFGGRELRNAITELNEWSQHFGVPTLRTLGVGGITGRIRAFPVRAIKKRAYKRA